MTSPEQKPLLPLKTNEGTIDFKRMKKTATDDNQSVRKAKIKNGDVDSNNTKITQYFGGNSQPRHSQLIKPPSHEGIPSLDVNEKIKDLEQKLKEKEKTIASLREKRGEEQQKINAISFQAREYKKKAKFIIAKSMREVAAKKRAQRLKVDYKLGYFSDGIKTFHEGEGITELKAAISQKEDAIKKLQQQKRSKSTNGEEVTRNIGSLEFLCRELSYLRKEFDSKSQQLAVYKDRLKLAFKEVNCQYHKANWPIIYDQYQTLQLLGSGGFGEVYKCYDLENDRYVAIKMMIFEGKNKSSDQHHRQDFLKHVQRQAEVQKELSHPNIAKFQKLVEINMAASRVVFQLQYCAGPELSVYLRKHKCLQQKEAKQIIRELFSALSYLYKLKEKVIHYDLKPCNIMFHNGIIKILDFGLCKVMDDSEDTKMQLTSQGVGTYWYLPPQTFEQYNPKISSKVDVWSLGVIFFQLLYGIRPFGNGVPQSQIYDKGIILRAYKVEFPAQTPKKYRVSEGAKDFISQCLKYNSDERLNPTEAYQHLYLKR